MSKIATRRRNGRWTRLVVAPLGAVTLVGLAACGTGTGSAAAATGTTSAPTAAASAEGQPDSAMAAYTSCLAENGVTMPEPPAGGGRGGAGGTPPPHGGGTPPSGAPEDGDGGPGGAGGEPGQAPPGVDATTWAAAQKACADLAPTPPDGTGSSATSGT